VVATPEGGNSHRKAMGAGNLLNDGRDLLAFEDGSGFLLLRLGEDTAWKQVAHLTLPYSPDSMNPGCWTIADINDDSQDELVACTGHRLVVFRWNGKEFDESSHAFPYLVDGIVAGDLGGDSLTRLALFAYDSEPKEPAGCLYDLCVVKFSDNAPGIIWNDSGASGYVKATVVPPDWLICVGDIMNLGSNQLAIAIRQSDMSPTRYHLLNWSDGALSLLDSFVISRGAFTRDNVEHNEKGGFPAIIGDLTAVECDKITAVLAHEFDPAREVLFAIRNDSFEILDDIAETEGRVWPNRTFWMDPDGKGKGVLQIVDDGAGLSTCYFHRKPPD
jgi:hypothetical protein